MHLERLWPLAQAEKFPFRAFLLSIPVPECIFVLTGSICVF
jgi:hypothetical protein